jgi:surface-anchored protein
MTPRARQLRWNRLGAVAGVVALTAALAGCTRTPITTGHIDALDVDYDGTNLTLDVRNHNVSPIADDVDPATVELHAVPASRTTVPAGSQWSFLGPAGSPVWVLPQVQRSGVLWPGWDTNDVPAGVLQNNRVTVRLVSVEGPGHFAVYTVDSFGAPTVRYDSADGLPDAMALSRAVHGHANWAFRAAGTYTLTFEAIATTTGGAARSSGRVAYQFVVEP